MAVGSQALIGQPNSQREPPRGLLHIQPPAALTGCLIALVIACAYANSFRGVFVMDDQSAIVNNPSIRSLGLNALRPPPESGTVLGRPLLNASFALSYALSGTEVWGYHSVNLLIHVVNALLLFGILRRTLLLPKLAALWAADAHFLAFSIALLWAAHPLQTESVTYIVQRAESLAALFYLLTLYCTIRGAQSDRSHGWLIAAVASCALGMASKETMVSAPIMVLAYDRIFLSASFLEALKRRWLFYLALATTWAPLAILVIEAQGRGGTAGLGQGVSVGAYAATQPGFIVHYLRLSIWPAPLVFDYGTAIARGAGEIVPFAIAVGLLALATVSALWFRPMLGFLGLWFFSILAPSSSIVPVVTQVGAEHRMYLPLAAVITLIILGLHSLWASLFGIRARAVPIALVAVVVAIYCRAVNERNDVYGSVESIWADTVNHCPGNARALTNLGSTVALRGEVDRAIALYSRALEENPDYGPAHYNLAVTLESQGLPSEAIAHYRKVIEVEPEHGPAHNNLGSALAKQGKFDEAERLFRRAVALKPAYLLAHTNLLLALQRQGKWREAAEQCRESLRVLPGQPTLLDRQAWLLGAGPDPAVRDPKTAIESARNAVQSSGGKDPAMLDTLAVVLAENGQHSEAIEIWRQAYALAIAQQNGTLVKVIESRLEAYRPPGGKPR